MGLTYPFAVAFLMQIIVGVPCIVARTEMIYDVTGAITYVLCAAFSYLARDQTGHLRAHIATLLVVLWAARLGTFLFLRIRKDGEDRRFRRIRNDPIKFFVVWMMQGLWICIVSLPLWLLNLGSNALPVAPVEYIGLALWTFGFALEVAADTQKSIFRADRRNANKFITTGVWAWSRHPNYLGEILLWFGLYLFVAPALEGWQHVGAPPRAPRGRKVGRKPRVPAVQGQHRSIGAPRVVGLFVDTATALVAAAAAMILSLYIINKSGGLIYHRDFASLPQLRGNEYLRLGSTFHSLHAISAQVSPAFGAKGIQRLEADTFDLHCFQTITGLKFFVLASKGTRDAQTALRDMYAAYTDYALKNPFYEVDMPIRCQLFDKSLERLVGSSLS